MAEACPHVSWATLACEGCGRYLRGCLACHTCADCQGAAPAPEPPGANMVEAGLRVCPDCLVKRMRPGQGRCDACAGSRDAPAPDEPEREPMSGVVLG
jgi:hypothetical protein